MIIYALDFPCGCCTDSFDPREWTLCGRHKSPQQAMSEWAAYGARVYRAMPEDAPVDVEPPACPDCGELNCPGEVDPELVA